MTEAKSERILSWVREELERGVDSLPPVLQPELTGPESRAARAVEQNAQAQSERDLAILRLDRSETRHLAGLRLVEARCEQTLATVREQGRQTARELKVELVELGEAHAQLERYVDRLEAQNARLCGHIESEYPRSSGISELAPWTDERPSGTYRRSDSGIESSPRTLRVAEK